MADIFISYARGDREKVERLAAALQGEGWSVWWDRQIVAGAEFTAEIERELAAAKAVIVAWSRDAIQSTWVKDEAITARDTGKLIPISTDGTVAPMGFKQFQAIDFGAWRGETTAPAFQDLARAVKARVTGEQAPASAPRARKRWSLSDPKVWGGALAAIAIAVAIGAFVLGNRGNRVPTIASHGSATAVNVETTTRGKAIEAASIAVLPFEDLSPGKDQQYFSDGVAEEILNVLARVDGLKVASRTSSFQFRNRPVGIPLIAKDLGVRHILEGSIRKAGGTIRVTAQMIDAGNDRHLWSETFDRPLTAENIFEIQDEIATAIVAALRRSLGLEKLAGIKVAPATDNVAAYELFLQARALFQARKDLDDADDLLSHALQQDPGFAKAWELRAALQNVIDEYGYSDLSREELDRMVVEFAQKALAIEPQSATAIAALANMRATATTRLRARHSLNDIIKDFRRALAIEPRDGSALTWLGLTYAAVGESEDALETFRRCVEFEPLYAPCVENEYEMLVVLGRMDEALEAYERALDRGLTTDGYVNFELLAHFELKAAFMLAANHSLWLRGWRRHAEIYDAFRNLDRDHDALVKDIRRFLTEKGGEEPEYISNLLMPLGARDLLPTALSLSWGKAYAKYRRTPEFKRYVRESGIEDYWRAVSFPPQCKPVGKDDFECN